jgi:hypothetical protein
MGLSVWTWHAKRWIGQCYIGHLHVLAPWDLSCRWRILRQDRGVNGVLSTLSLWKICFINIWCTFELSTIWKCVHTMNSNIVKYIWLLFECIYVNIIMWIWFLYEFEIKSYMNSNPVWIWIMYEFEFEIFKWSYNLYLLNGVDWF